MRTIENVRIDLISKILGIEDQKYLEHLISEIETSFNTTYQVSDEQKQLIEKGLMEIENGECITQEELDFKDFQWLSSK